MYVQTNMAAGARRINMDTLFTNRKLRSIHSVSVPRSRSNARAFSYAEKYHVVKGGYLDFSHLTELKNMYIIKN